jgi:hypothetical protein
MAAKSRGQFGAAPSRPESTSYSGRTDVEIQPNSTEFNQIQPNSGKFNH